MTLSVSSTATVTRCIVAGLNGSSVVRFALANTRELEIELEELQKAVRGLTTIPVNVELAIDTSAIPLMQGRVDLAVVYLTKSHTLVIPPLPGGAVQICCRTDNRAGLDQPIVQRRDDASTASMDATQVIDALRSQPPSVVFTQPDINRGPSSSVAAGAHLPRESTVREFKANVKKNARAVTEDAFSAWLGDYLEPLLNAASMEFHLGVDEVDKHGVIVGVELCIDPETLCRALREWLVKHIVPTPTRLSISVNDLQLPPDDNYAVVLVWDTCPILSTVLANHGESPCILVSELLDETQVPNAFADIVGQFGTRPIIEGELVAWLNNQLVQRKVICISHDLNATPARYLRRGRPFMYLFDSTGNSTTEPSFRTPDALAIWLRGHTLNPLVVRATASDFTVRVRIRDATWQADVTRNIEHILGFDRPSDFTFDDISGPSSVALLVERLHSMPTPLICVVDGTEKAVGCLTALRNQLLSKETDIQIHIQAVLLVRENDLHNVHSLYKTASNVAAILDVCPAVAALGWYPSGSVRATRPQIPIPACFDLVDGRAPASHNDQDFISQWMRSGLEAPWSLLRSNLLPVRAAVVALEHRIRDLARARSHMVLSIPKEYRGIGLTTVMRQAALWLSVDFVVLWAHPDKQPEDRDVVVVSDPAIIFFDDTVYKSDEYAKLISSPATIIVRVQRTGSLVGETFYLTPFLDVDEFAGMTMQLACCIPDSARALQQAEKLARGGLPFATHPLNFVLAAVTASCQTAVMLVRSCLTGLDDEKRALLGLLSFITIFTPRKNGLPSLPFMSLREHKALRHLLRITPERTELWHPQLASLCLSELHGFALVVWSTTDKAVRPCAGFDDVLVQAFKLVLKTASEQFSAVQVGLLVRLLLTERLSGRKFSTFVHCFDWALQPFTSYTPLREAASDVLAKAAPEQVHLLVHDCRRRRLCSRRAQRTPQFLQTLNELAALAVTWATQSHQALLPLTLQNQAMCWELSGDVDNALTTLDELWKQAPRLATAKTGARIAEEAQRDTELWAQRMHEATPTSPIGPSNWPVLQSSSPLEDDEPAPDDAPSDPDPNVLLSLALP
ncbi:hypothetical protein CAOG_04209 [Capsaspora owczarzaki ATCC 30864]|uniref:Uncharacterized protein n=1 Tax=Capsaspora owczarzaki (strain ATCC 30864) TaxID=595528 RepID=A0A0D2WPM9_CAPO3|nr:hypothetical protein CAOG_04209 [Capsaspora owczarzaki ATCC 30864]KJE93415.1 hypothetical protein CAOG_004209 [Capsaspora owczarzaki ATCC 30864]|eukprot:XP_004348034.1 hypothetical protein CAOG_04209 [Capsaspora owczarzaki ATCC 30864]